MGRTRTITLTLLLLFAVCCGGGGCPGGAGNGCDPNEQKCEYGYYCARIGVCTKECTTSAECQEGRSCTTDQDCKALETCTNGLCGAALECIESHCQPSQCNTDAGCLYDPYGPWTRKGDES